MNPWEGLLLISVAVVLTMLVALVVKSVSADGRIDYCYVQAHQGAYNVFGHRPWRAEDPIVGVFLTQEAAHAAAARCVP